MPDGYYEKHKAVRPEYLAQQGVSKDGRSPQDAKATPPVVDRQLVTFSCFAKEKVTKEKATPVCSPCGVPCVARLVRRLRISRYALKHNQRLGWSRLSA
jgi:hypothetical protein